MKPQLGKCFRAAAFTLLCFNFVLGSSALGQVIDGIPHVTPGAVGPADPIFDDAVTRGIQLVYNDQYEASLVIFNDLQARYPNHPAPYFFKAASYQSHMNSLRTSRYDKELEENIQLAIDKGNEWLEREDDSWIYFYIGAAYGYRALNRFRKHYWVTAYLDAKKAVSNFEAALVSRPDLYDVYLGLGSFHYWRTARSKFLRIIAFWIPDKRKLGLRQLEFAAEHGRYTQDEASYNLIAAYFDYEQYDKARRILNLALTKRTPPSVSDLYYKGRLLVKSQRWPEVASVFTEILQRLENSEFAALGYKVECRYWLALALAEQNRESEALQLTKEALEQSESRNAEKELESPFENFREIHARLTQLNKKLQEGNE
jgi:tetratricopeptide (TPR) repeat protein